MKLVILLLASLLSFSPSSLACPFLYEGKNLADKVDNVFQGEVINVSCDKNIGEVEFKVNKIWKGSKGETQIVYINNCQTKDKRFNPLGRITKGGEYLVYSKIDKDNLSKPLNEISGGWCNSDITLVRPEWKDWLQTLSYTWKSMAWSADWLFQGIYGVNRHYETLGTPIKEFEK